MLTVYSKEECPMCVQAKAYLDKQGVDYKVIMIVDHAMNENEISKIEFKEQNPSVRSVPYVVSDDGTVYRTLNELKQNV